MKESKQFILIITAFIILFGVMYGGVKEWTGTSSNITETSNEPSNIDIETLMASLTSNEPSNSNIATLMASLNIHQFTEPVKPPYFSLMSVSEERINIRQQRGKVVLLSFWATW
jgi:hypothetical protein